MKQIARLIAVMGAVALAACAAQGAPQSATAGPQHSAGDSKGVPRGYTHTVVDGQDMYCRNDVDTGSRVSRTQVCLTRDQLDEQERANAEATHQTRSTVIH